MGVDMEQDWDEIRSQIVNAPFTRMPVYRENLDNILGFIHLRKIFPRIVEDEITPEELKQYFREPYFIPEGTSLNRQLLNFQREKRRIGLVVDEYGDIQGMVTLDDILEEIVGDFTMDKVSRSREVRPLEDGNYLVDGRASLRNLNRNMDWELPEDEASTMNGLVLEILGDIPSGKASLVVGRHIITVLEIRENKIARVLVKPDRAPR
jgi:Mg2+/Co2+ transporter CorB